MSSESLDHQSPNNILYCNEDVPKNCANLVCDHIRRSDSDSLPDEESFIVNTFDSEADQTLESDSLRRFVNDSGVISCRLVAINWMLKVHGYCKFRPETAYLSVNYFDRFLVSTTLLKGKGYWPFQLLSVACLSLGAKMEEKSVPFLLDLQMKELPRFLFEPKTVQRMELMVMAGLKWKLHAVTPFDFVHYFVAKLSRLGLVKSEHLTSVMSHASDIILLTCQAIDFLDCPPSAIAAATVMRATDQYIDGDDMRRCFHQRVNKERVSECYHLMKQKIGLLPQNRSSKLISPLPSPVGVIDAAIGGLLDLHNKSKMVD